MFFSLIIIVLIVLFIVGLFNRFVTLSNRAKEAWSDIDVQLKRRYDLIPNLVNSVKGYAAHENSAFENVTKARAMAIGASGVAEQAKAENMLTGALKSLFAVAEAYPDLKANQNFLELQRELSDTENKIQSARRFYNGTVNDLNTAIEKFPGNIVASLMHFTKRDLFEITNEVEKETVKVEF